MIIAAGGENFFEKKFSPPAPPISKNIERGGAFYIPPCCGEI